MARRGTPVRREGRRPLIAGNWKMNLTHLEAIGMVQKLAFSLKEPELEAAEVVVLPPFTALRSVQTLVNGDKLEIGYGAQDLSVQDSGAYTGEVSGAMLAALACRYVVVGHSERRALHAEDDAVVAGKVQAALDRKSTRLNSSHANISYAVFCLKKKKNHAACTSSLW